LVGLTATKAIIGLLTGSLAILSKAGHSLRLMSLWGWFRIKS
jgi:divalent metal cation (Fe/Co/Zn/Cd) transporter